MLLRPMKRTVLAGAACLAMALPPGLAPADVFLENAYLPTSSVVLSSSVLPTSYMTTSYLPTSYLSTSYLSTSYLPTSSIIESDSVVYPTSAIYPTSTTTILRRGLFRPRRFVERSYYSSPLISTSYALPTRYLATASLLPTTYLSRPYISSTSYLIDDSVVATSGTSSLYPCETTTSAPVVTSIPRAVERSGGDSNATLRSVPSSGGSAAERRPLGTFNNGAGEEAPSSAVNPAAKEIPPPAMVPTGRPETPPSAPPLDERKPEDVPVPLPGESGKPVPPKPGETSFRTVRRPTFDGRNILRGRVVSAESKLPEEGVAIVLSSVTRTFGDRPTLTDAEGEFKVSLPDGDWTVKVTMPSGKVYVVGRDFLTASGGRVTDPSGRNVTEFLITR